MLNIENSERDFDSSINLELTMRIAEGLYGGYLNVIAETESFDPKKAYSLGMHLIEQDIKYSNANADIAWEQGRTIYAMQESNNVVGLELLKASSDIAGDNGPIKKYLAAVGIKRIAYGEKNHRSPYAAESIILGHKLIEMARAIPGKRETTP